MCLFRQGKLQIAEEDLITYKVLTSSLKSIYYVFQYELNKLYSKKWDNDFIEYCMSSGTIGGNTFHSSLDKTFAVWMYGKESTMIDNDRTQIRFGKLGSSQVLVKCIIPKGAKYFKGLYEEIASEQIIIKEICA